MRVVKCIYLIIIIIIIIIIITICIIIVRSHPITGTLLPLPTDALPIPTLCLGGRLPDKHGAVIILDLTGAAPAPGGGASAELSAWGEFHNGVAAGAHIIL